MTQNRSSAVMQQRAASDIEGDNDQRRRWRDLDYFPTPPWAARAIAARIKELDPSALSLWEPACGEGHFSEACADVFGRDHVAATDIADYGHDYKVLDFLAPNRIADNFGVDWVVTNPPFKRAAEFIRRGLEVAERGVVVLCRVALLESVERYELLYTGDNRMTALMPFVERVPMQLGSWDPALSSATAYAAFAFHKGRDAVAPLPFPPGTKKQFWHADDIKRFALSRPVPLFAKEGA